MTKPLSVLLIEDNPGDAELTREILEERKLRVAITVVDNPLPPLSSAAGGRWGSTRERHGRIMEV